MFSVSAAFVAVVSSGAGCGLSAGCASSTIRPGDDSRNPLNPNGTVPSKRSCLCRPLMAARCGKSNPRPGESAKSVEDAGRFATEDPPFIVRLTDPPARLRWTPTEVGPTRVGAATWVGGATRTVACGATPAAARGATTTGGPDGTIPPRCCAAAKAGAVTMKPARIKNRRMIAPSPKASGVPTLKDAPAVGLVSSLVGSKRPSREG
jgi:hypothetical protein